MEFIHGPREASARRGSKSTRFGRLLSLCALLLVLACSQESSEGSGSSSTNSTKELDAEDVSAEEIARARDPRPSVVLIVIDTLRADAVSSYGEVEGTTPMMDELGRSGLRYAEVYAPAPWTVSSHATLFSGLRVDQHGVGLDGASVVPDSLPMLAEKFRAAGYITAGFAENTVVSPDFGLDQGFDEFAVKDLVTAMKSKISRKSGPKFDLLGRLRTWNQQRDKSRPYFLFINIFDPHDPYIARDVNRWTPEDARPDEATYVQKKYLIGDAICDALPPPRDLDILRGLYLGDVAMADIKLRQVMENLDATDDSGRRLTVVTSDHGEHFGEHRLMSHLFSVRNPALKIPMIITGLPDAKPAVIDRPVELRQLHNSLLCWALGEPCPASLPTTNGDVAGDEAEPIMSIYSDSVAQLPDFLLDQFLPPGYVEKTGPELNCSMDDRVFGDMVSMIRYPMKMIWFENNEPVLHDLSWDPGERFDQMKIQPERAAALRKEIEDFVRTNMVEREREEMPPLDARGVEALKSLGYIR